MLWCMFLSAAELIHLRTGADDSNNSQCKLQLSFSIYLAQMEHLEPIDTTSIQLLA